MPLTVNEGQGAFVNKLKGQAIMHQVGLLKCRICVELVRYEALRSIPGSAR